MLVRDEHRVDGRQIGERERRRMHAARADPARRRRALAPHRIGQDARAVDLDERRRVPEPGDAQPGGRRRGQARRRVGHQRQRAGRDAHLLAEQPLLERAPVVARRHQAWSARRSGTCRRRTAWSRASARAARRRARRRTQRKWSVEIQVRTTNVTSNATTRPTNMRSRRPQPPGRFSDIEPIVPGAAVTCNSRVDRRSRNLSVAFPSTGATLYATRRLPMDTSSDRIVKTVLLRAPLERVWRAISEAQQFGAWFGVALRRSFRTWRPDGGTDRPHPGRRRGRQEPGALPRREVRDRRRPHRAHALVLLPLAPVRRRARLRLFEGADDPGRLRAGRGCRGDDADDHRVRLRSLASRAAREGLHHEREGWAAQAKLVEKYLSHAS